MGSRLKSPTLTICRRHNIRLRLKLESKFSLAARHPVLLAAYQQRLHSLGGPKLFAMIKKKALVFAMSYAVRECYPGGPWWCVIPKDFAQHTASPLGRYNTFPFAPTRGQVSQPSNRPGSRIAPPSVARLRGISQIRCVLSVHSVPLSSPPRGSFLFLGPSLYST